MRKLRKRIHTGGRVLLKGAATIILAGITGALAAHGQGASPVVGTTGGQLQGMSEYGIYAYKGIPYAASPVGKNRWRPPQPPQGWDGTRKANAFGYACMQPPGVSTENGGDPGPMSEDCLYLNVWTPDPDPARELPVVVWIHGGAYVFGAGTVEGYSGVPYAAKDVVFVNLNYRLGALGFFGHPALEGETGTVANFGLMDQIAALTWVRQNIAAFGGNPDNVTIMGQSAGAKSVMALYASPLAQGLFHKGVAMSVYVLPDADREKAQTVAASIASAVGLEGAAASVEDLRAIPAIDLVTLQGEGLSLGPVPIVGDLVLPASIQDTFANGQEKAAPLIIGSTSDDGSVISAFGISPSAIVKKMGILGIGLRFLYKSMSEEERARQAIRDAVFTMNPRWVAERHSKRAPTWRYYFDYVAEADREALPGGAPHGYEVAFFLETLPVADGIKDRYSEADMEAARKLAGYITEFARTGVPSSAWETSDRDHDRILLIEADSIKVKKRFLRRRLNAFIGITKLID